MGIPDEHIQKVFDPFFTTKLGQGGSGLGGPVEVRSLVGMGAEFRWDIPLLAPQERA